MEKNIKALIPGTDGNGKNGMGPKPSGRNVIQRHELLLLSNEAAAVAGRMLQGTMWSMHVLSVLFFFKSAELSAEEMQAVREGIRRMSELSRDFYGELESVRKKVRNGRMEALLDNVSVAPKFRRTVVLKTPMEKEFAVCLTNFDRLVVLYGFFWVNNLFNPVSCRKRITKLKNRLTDVCAYVLSVRHKLERKKETPDRDRED